jgi:hypothetical protein
MEKIEIMKSTDGKQGLKLKPIIHVNPPPSDGKCMCCRKHISELKPYGKAGDPLVGDFNGELLVKNFRPEGPYNEEAEKAVMEAEKHYADAGYEDPLDWMIKKYGKGKGEKLFFSHLAYCQTGKSWECRECIILNNDEYFETLRTVYGDDALNKYYVFKFD